METETARIKKKRTIKAAQKLTFDQFLQSQANEFACAIIKKKRFIFLRYMDTDAVNMLGYLCAQEVSQRTTKSDIKIVSK